MLSRAELTEVGKAPVSGPLIGTGLAHLNWYVLKQSGQTVALFFGLLEGHLMGPLGALVRSLSRELHLPVSLSIPLVRVGTDHLEPTDPPKSCTALPSRFLNHTFLQLFLTVNILGGYKWCGYCRNGSATESCYEFYNRDTIKISLTGCLKASPASISCFLSCPTTNVSISSALMLPCVNEEFFLC